LCAAETYSAKGLRGLGDDLAKNPDHALEPDIGYDVMSYGMRNGSYSPANKLSTYIEICAPVVLPA
jgi:hypothetical protein